MDKRVLAFAGGTLSFVPEKIKGKEIESNLKKPESETGIFSIQ